MERLNKKIKHTSVKNKSFNLASVIKQFFTITDKYIYDQLYVRPIEDLVGIEFYDSKSESNSHSTVGLLKVSWGNKYDNYDIWYKLSSYNHPSGVTNNTLKCLE